MGLAYDGLRERIVLFGGATASAEQLDDTSEWDGTWHELQSALRPAPRNGHAMAYDSIAGAMMVFGGSGSNALYEAYAHRFESVGDAPDGCIETDLDGDGLVGCADPDCWGRCQPTCPPATTCDLAQPHSGDGSCSAVENHHICPLDCP